MNRQQYWEIVDAAAAAHPDDEEGYLAFAGQRLAALSYRDRYRFSQFTGAYLHHADCAGVMMLCKVLEGGFSDDSLLYFTLWVLSRGKQFYLDALAGPDRLADRLAPGYQDRSFEWFMTLGMDLEEDSDAWSDEEIASWELTEQELAEVAAEIQYLNGAQLGGYGSVEAVIGDLPRQLPVLCALFAYEPEDELPAAPLAAAARDGGQDAKIEHYTAALEQRLGTTRQAAARWRAGLLAAEPPHIVGMDFFLDAVSDENTFLISNLYSRKKKLPAALVGFDITAGTSTTFYESTEKMLYKWMGRTGDTICIAGGYSGGVEADEVEGFFTHILLFDPGMQLRGELRLPCAQNEHLDAGCVQDGVLYLSFLTLSHQVRGSTEQKQFVLAVDLETGQVVDRIDGALRPLVCGDALYYLCENGTYQGFQEFDLYRRQGGQGALYLERVTGCAADGGALLAVQTAGGRSSVLCIYPETGARQELLSLEDCELTNLSAAEGVVAFDLHGIYGDRSFRKLTVFYHRDREAFRLLDADFLAHTIVGGGGFGKVIGAYYYAQTTDFDAPGASRVVQMVWRGDLRELFGE